MLKLVIWMQELIKILGIFVDPLIKSINFCFKVLDKLQVILRYIIIVGF